MIHISIKILRVQLFIPIFLKLSLSDYRWICRFITPSLISTISKYHLEIDTRTTFFSNKQSPTYPLKEKNCSKCWPSQYIQKSSVREQSVYTFSQLPSVLTKEKRVLKEHRQVPVFLTKTWLPHFCYCSVRRLDEMVKPVVLNLLEVREHFWLYEKFAETQTPTRTSKLMIQKTNKSIPRRNKYIIENILLNIFKFYILKYYIKFLQCHDNNKKKFGFHNFAEHLQKTRGTPVKNQWIKLTKQAS